MKFRTPSGAFRKLVQLTAAVAVLTAPMVVSGAHAGADTGESNQGLSFQQSHRHPHRPGGIDRPPHGRHPGAPTAPGFGHAPWFGFDMPPEYGWHPPRRNYCTGSFGSC
ncbi:hypothetical protein ACWDOP_15150 [Nocardia sp. NPDC003693]